jgi:hypothetical protein
MRRQTARRYVARALAAIAILAVCAAACTASRGPTAPGEQSLPSVPVLPPVSIRPNTKAPCNGVILSTRDDLQAAINAHPARTTFCFADGVYRIKNHLTPRDGDTFKGSSHAILDGSLVVGGWTHTPGGATWMAALMKPVIPVWPYRCRPQSTTTCHWDGDLFFDGAHLAPVGSVSAVRQGTVYVDQGRRKAYIGQDPTGHIVEEAVADSIIADGSGWTVDGLIMQKAANHAQSGALDGENITVRNAEIRLNHGVGVYGHDRSTIANNFIHDNGQMGFSGFGGPITITGNEIARNNLDGFEWQQEAGGGKCYKCSNATISRNYVHNNAGPGIWCDTDCIRVVIASNLVEDNIGPGIYYEISYQGSIRNNVVMRNATDLNASPLHVTGGIGVVTSRDVDVFGNTLQDNGNGIVLVATHRGSGRYGPYVLARVRVHDNTLRQPTGVVGMVNYVGDAGAWTARGNAFQHNSYFLAGNARPFLWQGNLLDPARWRAAGQDTGGIYVTGG